MWIETAMLQRKVALRDGSWTSDIHPLYRPRTNTILCSVTGALPCLYYGHIIGITASNQLGGPGRNLSFVDDVLVYVIIEAKTTERN